MLGIISFGAHIPVFRLSRDDIAKAWGKVSLGGERTIACNDEDTATMAVGAAFDCLQGTDRSIIDGVFFASTTPPYKEKGIASLVATVIDSREEVITADFANSLRSGTSALKMGYHYIKSGGAKNILITASDCRLGYPGSDFEQTFGDGGAALLLGEGPAIATIDLMYSVVNEMMDVWRNPEDTFVRSWESRWVLGEGYSANMRKAVQKIMQTRNLEAKDIQKAVLPAPDLRTHRDLVRSMGFQPSQVQDPLISTVGDCGTAQPLIMLIDALQGASPGDKILLAAYGDGVDAFLFIVTDEIQKLQNRKGIRNRISSKLMIPSYQRYLSYRGILETVPAEPFRLLPSATASWRDRDTILRCYGSKCRQCGTMVYPIQRVCNTCRARDNYDKVRLSEKHGKVFNFSLDNLAGRSDDPVVVQTIVELEGGETRFYCMMTDCIPSEVRLGMPVELTFRRLYEGAGFHNYFWKCRPIRDGGK